MDISVATRYAPPLDDHSVFSAPLVLKSLRRHLPLIVLIAVAGAAVGILYAHSVPKIYTASTSVALEGDRFAIPELQGSLRGDNTPDPMPFVKTEMQAITSRGFVQQVSGEVGLTKNPEFNPALQPPSLLGRAQAWIAGLFPHRDAPPLPGAVDDAVVVAASKALSLFQDNRSLVISLAFTSEDPNLSAKFLNTLVADYLASKAERRAGADRAADDVIDQRIAQVSAELDGLGKQVSELRTTGDIVSLRAGSVGQQQVEDLVSELAKASVERAQAEAAASRAAVLAKAGSTDAFAGALDSPTVSRLRQLESESASKVADLSARYGPAYPPLQGASADLAAVRRQLAGEIERVVASLSSQAKVARDKEAELQKQLTSAQQSSVTAENKRAKLDQLKQQTDTRWALYQTLLQRKQQTQAGPVGTQTPDIRVLTVASPPSQPSGPNTKLITGLGGLGGGVLGCLIALLRVGKVDGFNDPADVTSRLGLPVLATLSRRALRCRGLGSSNRLAVMKLRERLPFAGSRGVPQSVLVSPTMRWAVSGPLCLALAEASAAAGDRVLLIDANPTQPMAHEFRGGNGPTLASVLNGTADMDELMGAGRAGLVTVLSGSNGMGTADFSGVRFQNLLVETRQHFDLVILAGPDASTGEASALAVRADLTVLLLCAKSGYGNGKEAVSTLRNGTAAAFAAVLVT